MRKVTKKSLDELAKIMPPLSVEEQRSYIGGGWYTVDLSGNITPTDVPPYVQYGLLNALNALSALNVFDTISGNSGVTSLSTGILASSQFVPGTGNNYDTTIYTGNISLDLFEFLSRNTNVEWAYLDSSLNGRDILSTSNLTHNVSFPTPPFHVFAHYHSHPGGSPDQYPPSGNDMNAKDKGVSYYIYYPQTGDYVSY